MNKNVVATHYDDVMYSKVYNSFYGPSMQFNFGYWTTETRDASQACENLVDQLLEFTSNRDGMILDVACGLGGITKCLSKYYGQKDIIGINISNKQIVSCKATLPDYEFIVMDAGKLAFSCCAFQNIICVEAVFHFETREQFLKDAYRILKPGGQIILSDIVTTSFALLGGMYVPRANFIKDIDEYISLYKRIGFTNIQVRDCTNECWKSWCRHIMGWGSKMLYSKKISLVNYFGLLLGPVLGPLFIKSYILVSATK